MYSHLTYSPVALQKGVDNNDKNYESCWNYLESGFIEEEQQTSP